MYYSNKLTVTKVILIMSTAAISFVILTLEREGVGGSKGPIINYSLLGLMGLLLVIALFIDLYQRGTIERIANKLIMKCFTTEESKQKE